jgi:hypothetical protein
MDRLLESAVVLSWKDLVHPSQSGPLYIEYVPGTPLPYLKIRQLTGRGEWVLVCEYWMSRELTRAGERLTFSNGYHSAGLAEMLEVIMQRQDHFVDSRVGPRAGSIQVNPPTEQATFAASACMKHAYECFGLTFAHIPAGGLA